MNENNSASNVMNETNWTYGENDQQEIVVHREPKRMLYRNPSDKLIGGVCSGIADFLRWDPSLVRVAWVAMTLLTGGGGILAYIALWILLPVGTVRDGQLRPAAIALNEQNLSRVAFILIGLGSLWLLANIGILPWLWGLIGGIFRVLFWPALLIGAGYLVLRYAGKGFRWNVNETTERVKSEVNERMPSSEDVKSGMGSFRQKFPLKRSSDDRVFMGVCGGIGQKLGIDANLVRLVWAAFSIGSIGMGVLIYVLVGLFLPEEQPTDWAEHGETEEITIVDATSS